MKNIPPLALVAGLFAIVLGLILGLYAVFAQDRRRSMREICQGAGERGWRYQLRRWQGIPTAFRIDGPTHGGWSWVMTSGNTRGYDRGWSVVLELRVLILGGEADFVALPRGSGRGFAPAGGAIPSGATARVAAFSGAIASGLAASEAADKVLLRPQQFHQPPTDAELGQRLLCWPPHSVLAWRDHFGFHVESRLPGPANWRTVSYLAVPGEELRARVPAPLKSGAPTLLDRAIARILRP